ncbi:MAG: hypothetical protein ACRD1D_12090 [Acidimicrobiales bacterium]
MTLLISRETADVQSRAEAEADATPGCGCCLPPPDATADRGLARLLARRERLERRLEGLEGRTPT